MREHCAPRKQRNLDGRFPAAPRLLRNPRLLPSRHPTPVAAWFGADVPATLVAIRAVRFTAGTLAAVRAEPRRDGRDDRGRLGGAHARRGETRASAVHLRRARSRLHARLRTRRWTSAAEDGRCDRRSGTAFERDAGEIGRRALRRPVACFRYRTALVDAGNARVVPEGRPAEPCEARRRPPTASPASGARASSAEPRPRPRGDAVRVIVRGGYARARRTRSPADGARARPGGRRDTPPRTKADRPRGRRAARGRREARDGRARARSTRHLQRGRNSSRRRPIKNAAAEKEAKAEAEKKAKAERGGGAAGEAAAAAAPSRPRRRRRDSRRRAFRRNRSRATTPHRG